MTILYRLASIAALLAAGCAPDTEVRRYMVPHQGSGPAPEEVEISVKPESAKSRLLGAIAPRENGSNVFIKLSGDPIRVSAAKPAFDAFVKSLKFEDANAKAPAKFDVPPGWKPAANDVISFAAFQIPTGAEGEPLKLTVSAAGGAFGENLNRWRKQIGLKPVLPVDLPKSYTEATIDGSKVYLIDLNGPVAAGGMGGPPFAPRGR